MSIYAIGDVQGCFDGLNALLKRISFDEQHDTLWFTGDLVNRGADSLETLRFIKALSLKKRAITVLGNHDLHLLALHYVPDTCKKERKYLENLLNAPDCDSLCQWLRQQPFLHHDEQLNSVMTHAGIYPLWTLEDAKKRAIELESALQGVKFIDFLSHMYGNEPKKWDENLMGYDRQRFIINAFTRMRFCKAEGALDFKQTGDTNSAPSGFYPWFSLPNRIPIKTSILFGHWAALQGKTGEDNVFSLDGGYVWGNDLIAMRLEDGEIFRQKGL